MEKNERLSTEIYLSVDYLNVTQPTPLERGLFQYGLLHTEFGHVFGSRISRIFPASSRLTRVGINSHPHRKHF